MELNENTTKLNWLITLPAIIMIITRDFNWLVSFLLFGALIFIYRTEESEVPELAVERQVKGKNFKEGDHIDVVITIYNNSDVEFRGEVVDILPEYSSVWEGSNINLMIIPPHQKKTMKYQLFFNRRGKYQIGPVKLRHLTSSLSREQRYEIESLKEVIIIPQPDKINTYSLPVSFLTSIGGLFRSNLVGDGIDFSGVREYRTGDPMRRVNWKISAKYSKLHSNEFELNRSTNVIIVLDLTEESLEIADASVRAALGMAEFLINSRTRVGIITLGEYIHFLPVKSGRRHLLEITQHLTTVDSVRSIRELSLFRQRLNQAIERFGESNYEVLLFSSLNRPENAKVLSESLPKLGSLTVLAPTAIYFRGKSNPELDLSKKILEMRKLVIKRNLGVKGISIYEWVPDLPFDTSVSSWRSKQ